MIHEPLQNLRAESKVAGHLSDSDKMRIIANTIPHEEHRYPTLGDWTIFHSIKVGEEIDVAVSKMVNSDYEFLIMIHEIVEAYLCLRAGVPEDAITAFDIEYEKNRKKGDSSEPGDSMLAPYYHQHQVASMVELMIGNALGVHQPAYAKACDRMFEDDETLSKYEEPTCTCLPGDNESNVNCIVPCPVHGGGI